MTALYAQLESLTTTVAQLRRDAPRKAAKEYAAQLRQVLQEDEDEGESDFEGDEPEKETGPSEDAGGDKDAEGMDVDAGTDSRQRLPRRRRSHKRPDPAWELETPIGTDEEAERWRSGHIADVYEDALRTLQRLQGEGDEDGEAGAEGNALATTVGKAERAGRAAEVVESM